MPVCLKKVCIIAEALNVSSFGCPAKQEDAMTRFLTGAIKVSVFVLVIMVNGFSQSRDRAALIKEIDGLREQLKQKELELLAPSPEDRARFAEFLLQPNTGLARLLPREKYREKLSVREGGAYYSFTTQSNSYDSDPHIGLERDYLNSGFAGADFGFIASIGDHPIESIGLENQSVQYLANLVAPMVEPEAREQQRRSGAGVIVGSQTYKGRVPVLVGGSYILRSINYGRSDVLVAFRVVRQDDDGSLILQWKRLRVFPLPDLTRQ